MSDRQDDELTRNNSKMLEIALANRKEEIDRFWSRSSFYWVIVAAAFGGYAATENSDDLIRQIIASFGLIGSLAWMLTNIASKQWQAVWEEKTNHAEVIYFGHSSFVSSGRMRRTRKELFGIKPSVTRVTIGVSIYLAALWFILLFHAAPLAYGRTIDFEATVVATFTTIAALLLICCGQAQSARSRLLACKLVRRFYRN